MENETMVSENQVYEISFIFDSRIDEAKALEKADALKKDIASLNGSFISEETPYLRELSYEMRRVVANVFQNFDKGYFGWIKFELTPENVEALNKKLKLDEEVVRFMILKAEKGNDVFTKEKAVIKGEPTFSTSFVKDETVTNEDANIDTTKEEIEEVSKEEVEEAPLEETIVEAEK